MLGIELTPREKEVYGLILRGWSGNRIADELGISINTLSCHRQNILMKKDCYNCHELMALRIKELEDNIVTIKKIMEE